MKKKKGPQARKRRKTSHDDREYFTIKMSFGKAFKLPGEYGKVVKGVFQNGVDRFNLIEFLASKLATTHGKRTSHYSNHAAPTHMRLSCIIVKSSDFLRRRTWCPA